MPVIGFCLSGRRLTWQRLHVPLNTQPPRRATRATADGTRHAEVTAPHVRLIDELAIKEQCECVGGEGGGVGGGAWCAQLCERVARHSHVDCRRRGRHSDVAADRRYRAREVRETACVRQGCISGVRCTRMAYVRCMTGVCCYCEETRRVLAPRLHNAEAVRRCEACAYMWMHASDARKTQARMGAQTHVFRTVACADEPTSGLGRLARSDHTPVGTHKADCALRATVCTVVGVCAAVQSSPHRAWA